MTVNRMGGDEVARRQWVNDLRGAMGLEPLYVKKSFHDTHNGRIYKASRASKIGSPRDRDECERFAVWDAWKGLA